MSTPFQKMMRQLFNFLEIDPPDPDDAGTYEITFDDHLKVDFIAARVAEIILKGDIEDIPEDENAADDLLKKKLSTHLGRLKAHHEVLSIDPETSKLILFRSFDLTDLSSQAFCKGVEQFVDALEYWKSSPTRLPPAGFPPMPIMFP